MQAAHDQGGCSLAQAAGASAPARAALAAWLATLLRAFARRRARQLRAER